MKNMKRSQLAVVAALAIIIGTTCIAGQKPNQPSAVPSPAPVNVKVVNVEPIPVSGTVSIGNLVGNPVPVTGTVNVGNNINPVLLEQFSYEANDRDFSVFYGQFETRRLVVESISGFIDVSTFSSNVFPPAIVVGQTPSLTDRYVFYPMLVTTIGTNKQRWFFNPRTRIVLTPGQIGRFFIDVGVDDFNVVINGYYIDPAPEPIRNVEKPGK